MKQFVLKFWKFNQRITAMSDLLELQVSIKMNWKVLYKLTICNEDFQ